MTATKKGLIVSFEHIDAAGATTQIGRLAQHLKRRDKRADVLITCNPWRSAEIEKRLQGEKDPFSNGELMASLYTDDRARNLHELVTPNVNLGVHALIDRYDASTCAYQWTQGVPLEELIEMHRAKGIIRPDLTIFLDVSPETAKERLATRGEALEKFERSEEFTRALIDNYHRLAEHPYFRNSWTIVDGNVGRTEVAKSIREKFDETYDRWAA